GREANGVRVRRPRGSVKAAPTTQVQDLRWGLRVGMFADNGPSSGKGHKAGALVHQRRRMAISVPLAGAAGIFVAGIAYCLNEHMVASGVSPSRQWVAMEQLEEGTPQLQGDTPSVQSRATLTLARLTRERHVRFWQRVRVTFPRVPRNNQGDPQSELSEPETRVASASSPPPTNATPSPAPKPAFDSPATSAQNQAPTPREQPRKGKLAAYAKRALDQGGVPTSANPHAQSLPDRSAKRRVHRRGQVTVKNILNMIFSYW